MLTKHAKDMVRIIMHMFVYFQYYCHSDKNPYSMSIMWLFYVNLVMFRDNPK